MLNIIKHDLARIAKPTLINGLKWYFFPKGECFDFVVWLRIQQWIRHCKLLNILTFNLINIITYIVYRHFEFKYGIHPNANTNIGSGFRPIHGPCNLNAAKIGKNFTVYPGVTIGINHGGIPTIGDNVTIYTNSVVCGPITIKDGSIIRALSYTDKSI